MPTSIWANIGSGKVLLPYGTMQLLEPIITSQFCGIRMRASDQATLLHNDFENYIFIINAGSPRGQ